MFLYSSFQALAATDGAFADFYEKTLGFLLA